MRKHQGSEKAEYQNFLGHSSLNTGQLNAINLFEEPNFSEKHLDNYDGFFIGGFSDDPNDSLALTEEYFPFLGAFEQILNYAISIRKPGLLSCGGFMIASVLLGGEICLDESMQELDILSITRSGSEASDPLFQGCPKTFNIVSGHLKSTNILPPNCVLMASSTRCPIHVFKLKAAPIYAFQGHPEISAGEVKDRVGPMRVNILGREKSMRNLLRGKGRREWLMVCLCDLFEWWLMSLSNSVLLNIYQ